MKNKLIYIFLGFILFLNSCSFSQYSFRNGMVSSSNELASEIGIKILKDGGNAIDAAVGVGFALAVVYPQAGNIGGGGFMVLHLKNGTNTSIDYREKAPLLASRNMYLDSDGNVIEDLSSFGHLAAGVPGSVAGMLYALEKYGTKSRYDVMKYAISLAEDGFIISDRMAYLLNSYQDDFSSFEGTIKVFGGNFRGGDLLVQKDLAETLKEISRKGSDGFYKGWVADRIIDEMKKGNGIISYDDLNSYKPVERKVITGRYQGYDVITMGPPSSGGICLLYLLNIAESFDLKRYGYASFESINILAEAMKRVFADRSEFMGDMDFVSVPVDVLISKDYAYKRFKNFTLGNSVPSSEIKPGTSLIDKGGNTTHYSVTDAHGNCVSVTTTINDTFGNCVVVDGAGFFLNNEMDDFSVKPGYPNIYGLIGNEANAIEPRKRMLSSMTPSIILKEGKPFMITGSPGGGKIITSVFQQIVNVIEYGLTLEESIDLPRFHHQWLPDEIQAERNFLSSDVRQKLLNAGYRINDVSDFGRIDAVLFSPDGSFTGHSDTRGEGKAIGY